MDHAPGLFRREAVEAHHRPEAPGGVLRLSPAWVDRTYHVLVLAVVSGLGYAAVGQVGEYAAGPLVIELDERATQAATGAGTVSRVRVRPGERVEAGQVLVELHDALEQAELVRLDKAFELSLRDLLRDPNDRAAAASLVSLRSERELAVARVEERAVRATQGGIVGDVLVREGDRVEPGLPVASITGDGGQGWVTAVLPGRFGPLLAPGMPMLVELTGFQGTELQATVTEVGDAVIGPEQVRRILGAELGGALPIAPGPSVLVRARLPSAMFTAQGEPLALHHGMTGTGEVEVRTKRLLYLLVPALEDLW